ncbi:MAG: arabinose-5-phosphate isomerase [Bacteroides sp. 43_108]|nr:MAG: arabinose-5-phosphate isomerase [Bacteroides sp. 43_108]
MENVREYAVKCIKDEAQALLDLIPQLDEEFDKAVDMIFHCKGHLIVTGVGKSGHVGAKIAATLASTGTPSFFINPLDAMHGDLGMITEEDIFLMISNSGNTDELLRLVASLQYLKVPIISMTGNPNSLIARNSDIHIPVQIKREACPLNLAPTSSTTAALAMGDAIACALMEVRHFKANDFAKFHPGGSLGRKLVTRVRDVMYTDNFPILPMDMKLSEALIHISNGKLGLGVVIEDEKIKGIITDGDIRRAVEGAQSNFFNLSVKDIMTVNPKTIGPDAKLTQIQAMFRKHKIHSLLVVDADKHLIGIVDYFAIMGDA